MPTGRLALEAIRLSGELVNGEGTSQELDAAADAIVGVSGDPQNKRAAHLRAMAETLRQMGR